MPRSILKVAGVGGVDVYGQLAGGGSPTLLWDRKFQYAESDVAKLRDRGIEVLWVSRNDSLTVGQQLRQAWPSVVNDGSLSPCDRFAMLQIALAPEINASYRLLKCDRFVELVQQTAGDLTTVLVNGAVTPRELFDAAQRGVAPGLRATNLAGYAVLLAQRCRVATIEELREIAGGAMLHDVGARLLAPEAILAVSRLSPEERRLIERHPRAGYEELFKLGTISHGQLMMAYQHHEHIDGAGYPVAVLGDEIHPWAKMLAVVDLFDSYTNGQRKTSGLPEALAQLEQAAGTQLDSEMTACWKSSLLPG